MGGYAVPKYKVMLVKETANLFSDNGIGQPSDIARFCDTVF